MTESSKELKQKITDTEKFTQEYWWPRLTAWTNSRNGEQITTPTYGAVLEAIIKNRGEYVEYLKHRLMKLTS